MNLFNGFVDFFKSIWGQANSSTRFGLVAAAILLIGVVAGVGWWSSQPHYIPLTDTIGPLKAAELKEQLDSANIHSKLSFAGNAVLVDHSQLSQARAIAAEVLESGDLLDQSSSGWSMMPGSGKGHAYQVESKELALAKKIEGLDEIHQATVTLAIPEPTPFVRNRVAPTASVMVRMAGNHRLTRKLANAINVLVANSVDGLQRSNVDVIDTQGNYLGFNESGIGTSFDEQNEKRRAFEQALVDKAMQQLELVLGYGMADVKVSADIDFTHQSTTQEIYDPDGKVKVYEELTTKETKQTDSAAAGPAGTGSNLASRSSTSSIPTSDKQETVNSGYLVSKTETTEVNPPGDIKRLSVSVVAEFPSSDIEDAPAADGAVTESKNLPSQEEMEALVKTAVDFNQDRGDQFTMVFTRLAGRQSLEELFDESQPTISPFWLQLVRHASLGLAAVVALLLGFLVIKRIQPISFPQDRPADLTPARARQISDMSNLVKENPELLARIIAAWSPEHAATDSTGDSTTDSSAPTRKAA